MNLSIKLRIYILPISAFIILTISVAVCWWISASAISSIRTTERVDYPVLDQSKALIGDVSAVAEGLKEAVTEGDKKRIDQIAEMATKVKDKFKRFGEIPGQSDTANRVAKEFDAYYGAALSAAKIMMGIDTGDTQAIIGQMQSSQKTLESDLAKINESAQKQFQAGVEASGSKVNAVLYTTVGAGILVIVALGVASLLVVSSVWNQLGGEPEYAREITRAVADGDLSMVIDVSDKNGTSVLSALKDMQSRLQSMVSDIKTSAETIKTASAEIASGNADLSSRTESQASSLEETASSMETLTDTVRQNADNARQANQLVVTASDFAVKGGEVVGQVVETMGEINGSAKKIVEIISVIDGIAFQTNILALNAAVEAARAGEQGRGFAVVAAEVRNLAQRSAAAAKEIKALIGDSVEKVEQGSRLVDEAGKTMEQIVGSVRRVTDIMSEITAASQEQSAGIQEVSLAVGQMDEMTQQNSALVEEAAAAAESMQEQADSLMVSLDVFRLPPGSLGQTSPQNRSAMRLTMQAHSSANSEWES